MAKVIWTLQSIEDIENIAEFISRDSAKYAQIQVQEFFEAALVLEKFPTSGRIVPELNDGNIREIIVGFYRIIYEIISDKKIDILTVHHSYRTLKSKIKRLKK